MRRLPVCMSQRLTTPLLSGIARVAPSGEHAKLCVKRPPFLNCIVALCRYAHPTAQWRCHCRGSFCRPGNRHLPDGFRRRVRRIRTKGGSERRLQPCGRGIFRCGRWIVAGSGGGPFRGCLRNVVSVRIPISITGTSASCEKAKTDKASKSQAYHPSYGCCGYRMNAIRVGRRIRHGRIRLVVRIYRLDVCWSRGFRFFAFPHGLLGRKGVQAAQLRLLAKTPGAGVQMIAVKMLRVGVTAQQIAPRFIQCALPRSGVRAQIGIVMPLLKTAHKQFSQCRRQQFKRRRIARIGAIRHGPAAIRKVPPRNPLFKRRRVAVLQIHPRKRMRPLHQQMKNQHGQREKVVGRR